jgi:hypothetical protein
MVTVPPEATVPLETVTTDRAVDTPPRVMPKAALVALVRLVAVAVSL